MSEEAKDPPQLRVKMLSCAIVQQMSEGARESSQLKAKMLSCAVKRQMAEGANEPSQLEATLLKDVRSPLAGPAALAIRKGRTKGDAAQAQGWKVHTETVADAAASMPTAPPIATLRQSLTLEAISATQKAHPPISMSKQKVSMEMVDSLFEGSRIAALTPTAPLTPHAPTTLPSTKGYRPSHRPMRGLSLSG